MMSHYRTFSRSNRKEQAKKKPNIGIRALQKMAHAMIEEDPQLYLDKLAELFLVKGAVTAGTKLFDLASEAQMEDEVEEAAPRRPSLIERWVAECEQQDRDKQQKEAEAAQQAASRELGQFPEPETATETAAAPAAQSIAQPLATHSSIGNTQVSNTHVDNAHVGNTHVNEIGLPLRALNQPAQSQTADSSGSRLCRTTLRPDAPSHESTHAALNKPGAIIYAWPNATR